LGREKKMSKKGIQGLPGGEQYWIGKVSKSQDIKKMKRGVIENRGRRLVSRSSKEEKYNQNSNKVHLSTFTFSTSKREWGS